MEKVYDGNIDCLTSGDDESDETRHMMATQRFPHGERDEEDPGCCAEPGSWTLM